MSERFYKYPSTRDVVFLFGAGASAGDGVPLQGDLLGLITKDTDLQIRRTAVGDIVDQFLSTFFDAEIAEGVYPSLEEVFGLIDYHVAHGEHLSEIWTDWSLMQARDALVKVIHYVVHAKRASEPTNYRAFWDLLVEKNRNISIVTMNYDAVLEEAFDPLFLKSALIDYCLPLMNYDAELAGFNWWVNPREPFWDHEPGITPIKVIKIHGSLNWKYCGCCRGVLLTPWDTAIDLDRGVFVYPDWLADAPGVTADYECHHCGVPFDTCIVPPSHTKVLTHPALVPLITEAIQELRCAQRIVIVGYSFPEADVHLRGLLARAVRTSEVTVIDPGLSINAKARYRSIFSEVEFIEVPFAAAISDGTLERLMQQGVSHGA